MNRVSTLERTRLDWSCAECREAIEDGAGYLWCDVSSALDTLRAEANWRTSDPDPESGRYVIDVDHLRSPWDLVRWTCHLMEKNWLGATNWLQVLRYASDRAGAREA
jgi:hypothetical protein